MAETFTINNNTESEVLTAEEQDSLAVGEKLVEEQEGLLAGKYENAQELEKAYIELQKKLGSEDAGSLQEGDKTSEEEVEETVDSPAASLISEASAEYYSNDNSLSEETIAKFSEMSSTDLVNAYVESLKSAPATQTAEVDMTDAQVNQIQNSVGGEQQYNQVVSWAAENLPAAQVNAFDQLIGTGNTEAIKLAVAGIKAQYDDANGYEGRTLQGKAPRTDADIFRSQAELVAAMSDPRYDSDPAYRADVIQKLDRSGLDF